VMPESAGASEGETSTVLGGRSLVGNRAALCSLVTLLGSVVSGGFIKVAQFH